MLQHGIRQGEQVLPLAAAQIAFIQINAYIPFSLSELVHCAYDLCRVACNHDISFHEAFGNDAAGTDDRPLAQRYAGQDNAFGPNETLSPITIFPK